MAKKKSKITQYIMFIVGIILMLTSYIIYKFSENIFMQEVHSEIFGVGAAVFVIGFVWMLFKIRLD